MLMATKCSTLNFCAAFLCRFAFHLTCKSTIQFNRIKGKIKNSRKNAIKRGEKKLHGIASENYPNFCINIRFNSIWMCFNSIRKTINCCKVILMSFFLILPGITEAAVFFCVAEHCALCTTYHLHVVLNTKQWNKLNFPFWWCLFLLFEEVSIE